MAIEFQSKCAEVASAFEGVEMKEIRAFVGHSFSREDAYVVRQFLDHFDHIAQLHPTFSWTHAEAATPQELAAKVLAQVEGKNVFIGICTRKERVQSTPNDSLLGRIGITRTSGMTWKTSDWIIQEIGLAKGLGLDLVLLIEQGVRKPGGLQGDIEYIEFQRDAPEKSFNKIIEMIAALSPKVSRSSAVAADTTVSSRGESKDQDDEEISVTPTAAWTRDDYERALTHLMLKKDEQGAAVIHEAYLAVPESAEGDNRVSWLANSAWMKLILSDTGDLTALKEIVQEHPTSPAALEFLALGFEQYNDYLAAGESFLAAERLQTESEDKRRLVGNAAVCLIIAGQDERSEGLIRSLRAAAEASVDAERQLLRVLRRVSEWKKNDRELVPILERYIELTPDDLESRFNLAFKHSELGNRDLALLHYSKVPFQMRSGILWNNLGAEYDEFVMPGKAVLAFQQSEQKRETLAMSNLARKLANAGFIQQAKEICEKALGIENYHNNAARVLAELRDIEEQEEKKPSELRDKAAPKAKFYQDVGRAVTKPEPSGLSNYWIGPTGVLELKQNGDEITISGAYEVSNTLSNALAGIAGGAATRWLVEYTGKLRGRAIDGAVLRRKEGERPKSLLEAAGSHKPVLMVIAPDLGDIRIVEEPQSMSPAWCTLKAQAK